MARDLNVLFWVLVVLGCVHGLKLREPQVPCYFQFGDSLVDNGNNNGLRTTVKANYPPYGIDFSEGATGRFSNGRTIFDIIGQLLGFPNFIPPYATVTDQAIRTGVNYASGSGGIRDETGSHLGDRISMNRQLLNHKDVISRLSFIHRNKTLSNDLKKCIYIVNMGNNDYIFNYLLPNYYPTSRIYNTDQFAQVLVQQYSQQLKTLYKLGARKIAVFGLARIGCTPTEKARFGVTEPELCVDSINNAVRLFNEKVKPLVDRLNNDNSDARFTFINLTSISIPPEGGVALPNTPCCQLREDGQCVPNSVPCSNRGSSTFYDGFRPNDIANTVLARRSYNALSPIDASPYDISRLAKL